MFKKIGTAIVLIFIFAAILVYSPLWLFNALVMVLVAGGLYEFYKLTLPNDIFSLVTGLTVGLASSTFLVFGNYNNILLLPVSLTLFFILVLLHMARSTTAVGVIERIGLILFGTAYISFTLPFFVWLRAAEHGRSLIVFTVAIVAMGDGFAYFVGKLFGRHKLAPLISPNKTVEGFIASFFGGVTASVVCWKIFWPELPIALVVFLGLSVALIGSLGDLVESLIKRAHHVKDSGNFLPGHGGFLDRLDALLFAGPFVFFTFKFLGWI